MIYIEIIFIALVGTILHFTYELSHHNKVVAIFSAVNESTWEHIKIGLTPTILWSLYDGYVYGMNANYLVGKALCILTIILLISILFYLYTAFTKRAILVIDIICFYITIVCSRIVFHYFLEISLVSFIYIYLSCILLFFELGAYLFLTFNPLKNFIFEDPISHKYGLRGHNHKHEH